MASTFYDLPLRTLVSGKAGLTRKLTLDTPRLMGILNITPDSFSDGGRFFKVEDALAEATKIINEGADWLDIGGESSGPNSPEVSVKEELRRVVPLIQAVRKQSDIWISVDTWKAEVARQALKAGANAVNDVTALRGDPELAQVVAENQVPVVLMYSKNATARTTNAGQDYVDVLGTLKDFFKERLKFAQSQGILKKQILLDPGMGFFISGKAKYSFEVIQRISELHEFNLPLLLGPSRKSFLAHLPSGSPLDISERNIPCVAVSGIALWQGVSVLRLHDAAQGRLLINTIQALKN